MTEYEDVLAAGRRRSRRLSKFRPWALFAVPLAAILFQVYVPRFFQFLSNLDLPLLVTIYFSVMRRTPIAGIFTRASIGLVQASLSNLPLGMFGMVKTLVGFTAASVSVRFDVERAPVRFTLGFFFFLFHYFAYWILGRALLGQGGDMSPLRPLLLGLLNAIVAVPLFGLFDKLRRSDD